MEDNVPSLSSAVESAEYYKALAAEYKKRLDETQKELEEFQESSRELEAELEAQLEQSENRNKELRYSNSQLQWECERLQNKLSNCQEESHHTISNLQEELAQTKLVKDDLHQYVRRLEQKNDDLERATRASLTSLEDFEGRLNQAIERNAFLENELDEKENMAVLIQRLKDEARDLKQELLIHENHSNNQVCQSPSKVQGKKVIDSNRLATENGSPIRPHPRRSYTHPSNISSASSNVPHSALNIVGDLLKKVGVLESKLQSCRNCVKDKSDPLVEKHVSSPITSPNRVRHINGSSLPSPKDCIPLTA